MTLDRVAMKIDSRIIHQVIDVTSRQPSRTSRGDQLGKRLNGIRRALEEVRYNTKDSAARVELFKYIPIGLVACIQGYFVLAIQDLIDSGEPYSENVCQLKDLHFKMESVIALQGRQVSLGEVVVNMLSLSSIDGLFSNIDTIVGYSFKNALQAYNFTCPCCGQTIKLLDAEPAVFKDVSEVFKYRNIFCHELAPNQSLPIKSAERFVQSISFFLIVVDSLVEQLLVSQQSERLLKKDA